jgi:hypothetical protein
MKIFFICSARGPQWATIGVFKRSGPLLLTRGGKSCYLECKRWCIILSIDGNTGDIKYPKIKIELCPSLILLGDVDEEMMGYYL